MKIYLLSEKYPDKERTIFYQLIPNESGLGVISYGRYLGTTVSSTGEKTHKFSRSDGGGSLVSDSALIYWAYYEDLQSQYKKQQEVAVITDPGKVDYPVQVNERLQERIDKAEDIMEEALDWIDEMPFKKVNRRVRDLMHQFVYGGTYHIDDKDD